jgi:hypothetical protein
MSLSSYLRCVVTACAAAALSMPVAFAAAAPRQQANAQLLDHAEFLCDNCFFGASQYFYCLASDNLVLVGYQKSPVMNWQDKSKNYLTPMHHGWAAWQASGQAVPISYDDKYIYVNRANLPTNRGFMKKFAFWASHQNEKQVKLKRSDMRDIFLHNDRCRGAATASK